MGINAEKIAKEIMQKTSGHSNDSGICYDEDCLIENIANAITLARNEALEVAAKVADQAKCACDEDGFMHFSCHAGQISRDIRDAIRQLKADKEQK